MRLRPPLARATLLACVVTGLALGSEPPQTPTAQPTVRREVEARLTSGRYPFCSEDSYRLWQADKDRLCERRAELDADCPGLAAACQRPSWDEASSEPTSPDWLWELAQLLGESGGTAFRVLYWAALGLGVLYLGRALVRSMRRSKSDASPQPVATVAASPTEEEWSTQPAPVLLDRAQAELDRDPIRALHLAYAALLAALGQAGHVRVHRALTTGDYRRALARAQPESRAGSLLWDLDWARFQRSVDGEGARRLLLRVRELISVITVLAFLSGNTVLSGCAHSGGNEPVGSPGGPRGLGLFEELARARAPSFTRRLKRVTDVPVATTTAIVVEAHLRPLEWQILAGYVATGGHLLVAGTAAGFEEAFGQKLELEPCPAPLTAPALELVSPGSARAPLVGLVPTGADAVLGSCGALHFARVHRHGNGWVTLVADASFLDNTSLAFSDNASFALDLIKSPVGHVEFIGPWTGPGALHPLESVTNAGVGPWLLHLLAALTLLAWSRGRRFGSPRKTAAQPRRTLAEHVEALAGHYRRSGDLGGAVARYATWAIAVLGRRSGSSNRDLRALAESLHGSRKVSIGMSKDEVHQLLLRARAGAELGGDKAKLLRAFQVLRTMVDEVAGHTAQRSNRR